MTEHESQQWDFSDNQFVRDWCKKRHGRQIDLAKSIGATPAYVNRVCTFKSRLTDSSAKKFRDAIAKLDVKELKEAYFDHGALIGLLTDFVEAVDHIGSNVYDWERVLLEITNRTKIILGYVDPLNEDTSCPNELEVSDGQETHRRD